MKKVFAYTDGLTRLPTHYCPGCTHGVIHRLVGETIVELGLRGRTVGVAPVGCSVLAYKYFNCDMFEASHGRAPAVATGAKRTRPNLIVFTIRMGRGFVLAIHDFSTGKSTPVATGSGDAIEPSWLADGRHVVFTARGPNTRRTMIVDTETGKTTALSPSTLGQVSHAHPLAPR